MEEQVDARISPRETMMDGDLSRYLSVGRSAVDAVKRMLSGREPESILDLPCGHGRVARHLRSRYPKAELFVADLDRPGAEFCATTFGATLLDSNPDFDAVDFQRKFDLIWVGSLITHLREEDTDKFIRFLGRHLSRNGTAVVTSHGPFVAGRLLARKEALYELLLEQERAVLRQYFAVGYGYAPYYHSDDYGISLISKSWLESHAANAGLSVVNYEDHGWDFHQDVMALQLR